MEDSGIKVFDGTVKRSDSEFSQRKINVLMENRYKQVSTKYDKANTFEKQEGRRRF